LKRTSTANTGAGVNSWSPHTFARRREKRRGQWKIHGPDNEMRDGISQKHPGEKASSKVVMIQPDDTWSKARTLGSIEFESLNQCFSMLSARIRPGNRSHSCNVFKVFSYKNKPLDELRIKKATK